MQVVGLISGGKDSIYNLMCAVRYGHEIVAVAHLAPPTGQNEIDSWMYQSVGHNVVALIAEALGVPLFQRIIGGQSLVQSMEYSLENVTENDEVEDMYQLLRDVKESMPCVQGVCAGAVLSDYQRIRVENVCMRLQLTSFAFLWQRNQAELLDEMIENGVEAIVIKVACMGLNEKHLGKTIAQLRPVFHKLNASFGCHICGEGGEYETLTLNCPLYKKKIVLDDVKPIFHSEDDVAPVVYLVINNSHLEPKSEEAAITHSTQKDDIDDTTEDDEQSLDVIDDNDNDNDNDNDHVPVHWNPDLGKNIKMLPMLYPDPSLSSLQLQTEFLLSLLHQQLETLKLPFSQVVFVTAILQKMSLFSLFNDLYSKAVPMRCPPARACVAQRLPKGVYVALEVVISLEQQQVLHVQSVSSWAPSNIGPYSQAKKLENGNIFVAGQIGLKPETMTLRTTFAAQLSQTLRNSSRLLHCLGSDPAHVHSVVFYTTHPQYFARLNSSFCEWNESETTPILCVAVSELPRMAKVEMLITSFVTSDSCTGFKETSDECSIVGKGVADKFCSVIICSNLDDFHSHSLLQRLCESLAQFSLNLENVATARLYSTSNFATMSTIASNLSSHFPLSCHRVNAM